MPILLRRKCEGLQRMCYVWPKSSEPYCVGHPRSCLVRQNDLACRLVHRTPPTFCAYHQALSIAVIELASPLKDAE